MQKNLLIIITIALIAVIVAGAAVWVFTNPSQNADAQPTPTLQTTPTSEATPTPESELSTQEQVRDEAINYIKTRHNETVSYLEDLVWTGGREDTGLLGAEVYSYNTACWTVTIEYPVIQNPMYTITANFSAGSMSIDWTGTYENGAITETSYTSNNLSTLTAQEQIRDAAMNYIKINHSETAVYMQDLSWTGGVVDQGMLVGSSKYSYESFGWNVTMQYPVVLNPKYTITINYASPVSQVSPAQNIVTWEGTWQNGTITETSYSFTP